MEAACARALKTEPDFNIVDALAACVRDGAARGAHEDYLPTDRCPEEHYRAIFGDSPLTSPESSPPSSRPPSPTPILPITAPQQPLDARKRKQGRQKRKGHERRGKKRRLKAEGAEGGCDAPPRASIIEKYVKPAVATQTSYEVSAIPSASTGFVCRPDREERLPALHLKELTTTHGLRLQKWDGRAVSPLVDRNNKVFGVIAGCPDDPTWPTVQQDAFEALCGAREACHFPASAGESRRGGFLALNVGVGAGNGRQEPGNIRHGKKNLRELHRLLENDAVKRISGFANKVFRTWAPRLHAYYEETFNQLLNHDPQLVRNFDNSVWASAAFNLGPQTVCNAHRDFANLPFGLCSVTALGHFNPRTSALFVFWPLGVVVEFPPGSTLLLLSAAVAHANTPMGSDETRCSITQYSPGGLFRWVEHGFQLNSAYYGQLSDAQWEEELVRMDGRCKAGLAMLSTLDELRSAGKRKGGKNSKRG